MMKKYSNLIDKEYPSNKEESEAKKNNNKASKDEKGKTENVAPKSLIFKANFDQVSEQIEDVKEHWVNKMNIKTFRTKIKRDTTQNNSEEGTFGAKYLKFYHQDITEEEVSYNININNKNEIASLEKQYKEILS